MDGGERSNVCATRQFADSQAVYERRVFPPTPRRQQARLCRETIRLTTAPAERTLGRTRYKYPVNEGTVDVGGCGCTTSSGVSGRVRTCCSCTAGTARR